MKKSRNDAVKSTLLSYLERRNYPDVDLTSPTILSQTAEQMAVSAIIDSESSRSNSILFSCINNDPSLCDTQFTKLMNFIKELKVESIRKELLTLLCPLLCHMYLEMLRGGHGSTAQMFLKRHSSSLPQKELSYHQAVDGNLPSALYRPNSLEQLFNSLQNGTIDNDTHDKDFMNQILDDLGNIYSLQEIESRPMLVAFRSCKFELPLSQESLNVLKKYLTKHGHVVLLQILQTWFHIDINNADTAIQNAEDEESDQENSRLVNYTNNNINDTDNFSQCNGHHKQDMSIDEDMRQLQDAIKAVREGPLPLKLYNINAPDTHLISCELDSRMLYAGFHNSQIGVYNIGRNDEKLIHNKNISTVELACNVQSVYDDNYITDPESDCTSETGVCLQGHSGPVQDLSLLEPERILLSVSQDNTMRAWNLKDFSCAAIYRGHNYPIWSVDVTSHGLYMVTGSQDRTAKLWTLERTYPLRIFAGHILDVNCVKFHPNGMYICTGGADKCVRLWSISGRAVRLFTGHRAPIHALQFSCDGRYLASAGEDKKIRIWDLTASTCIEEKRTTNTVKSLAWVKDTLLAATSDGTLRMWKSSEQHTTYNTKCTYLVNTKLMPQWIVAMGTTR